jgi:hypothetical protein
MGAEQHGTLLPADKNSVEYSRRLAASHKRGQSLHASLTSSLAAGKSGLHRRSSEERENMAIDGEFS